MAQELSRVRTAWKTTGVARRCDTRCFASQDGHLNIPTATGSSSASSIGSAGTNWNLLAVNSLAGTLSPTARFDVTVNGSLSGFNSGSSYQWDFITWAGGLNGIIPLDQHAWLETRRSRSRFRTCAKTVKRTPFMTCPRIGIALMCRKI
jgi:hypothetical protein